MLVWTPRHHRLSFSGNPSCSSFVAVSRARGCEVAAVSGVRTWMESCVCEGMECGVNAESEEFSCVRILEKGPGNRRGI
jgi:hypothetical protein